MRMYESQSLVVVIILIVTEKNREYELLVFLLAKLDCIQSGWKYYTQQNKTDSCINW